MLEVCPSLTFLPLLLLLTSFWYLHSHSNKNSRPDFRVATRDFRMDKSPCSFPKNGGEQRFFNPSLVGNMYRLYFKLELRAHEPTKFYTWQGSFVVSLFECIL